MSVPQTLIFVGGLAGFAIISKMKRWKSYIIDESKNMDQPRNGQWTLSFRVFNELRKSYRESIESHAESIRVKQRGLKSIFQNCPQEDSLGFSLASQPLFSRVEVKCAGFHFWPTSEFRVRKFLFGRLRWWHCSYYSHEQSYWIILPEIFSVGITCQLIDLLPGFPVIMLAAAFAWQSIVGFR